MRKQKLDKKGADWIVANDVSHATGVMGGDRNAVRIVSRFRCGGMAGHEQRRGCGATGSQNSRCIADG